MFLVLSWLIPSPQMKPCILLSLPHCQVFRGHPVLRAACVFIAPLLKIYSWLICQTLPIISFPQPLAGSVLRWWQLDHNTLSSPFCFISSFFSFSFFNFFFIFSLVSGVFASEALAQVHHPADVSTALLDQSWLVLMLCDFRAYVCSINAKIYIVQFHWVP